MLKNSDISRNIGISELIHKEEGLVQYQSPESLNKKPPHLTGIVQMDSMSDFDFNQQYYQQNASKISEKISYKKRAKQLKKLREKYENPGTDSFKGPWAKYISDQSEIEDSKQLTKEQEDILTQMEIEKQRKLEAIKKEEQDFFDFKPTSICHLEQTLDYQGRSFIEPPTTLKYSEHNCYIPKKLIHTYMGHTKPVQVIKFFPNYGHYLLSCSLDGKIKLWDVLSHKKCAMTYINHSEGVRDICFANDGKHFISCGYDKSARYWDTETGKVIQTFRLNKLPFCIKINPDEDRQNEFLVGTNLKQILQFDINSPQPTLTYEEHVGAINTLTFIDNNRKFVTTSDDKKIFIWEYGISVAVKHISEPTMQSLPAVAMHPKGKFFVGQSLDNKIVVYDVKNGFKNVRKKKFVGHLNAGFACGIDFSPDGQFLCSGDAEGKIWFWDWRSTKNYTTLNGHTKVCINVRWHPIMPSLVASCSWDGSIKLWDTR